MANTQSFEIQWQNELFEYVTDDFEKKVIEVAIKEKNPDGILQSVREIIREKLHENKQAKN